MQDAITGTAKSSSLCGKTGQAKNTFTCELMSAATGRSFLAAVSGLNAKDGAPVIAEKALSKSELKWRVEKRAWARRRCLRTS